MAHTPSNPKSWLSSILATVLAAAMAPGAAVAGSAAEIIDAMIAAHGGMERWAKAPTVSFEDEFRPGTAETGAPSRVTVEQGRRRAYIDYPGSEARLAWDGEKAWSENWASPYPPRFLALLNYHFVNLPWLAKDPGVVLGEPATGRLLDDPTEYLTVRLTYDAGVGDTPGDYYVLYIDPESHRLRANEYIVTYRSLLPEGVEASQPHILIYDEYATVDGLVVPTHYSIYQTDGTVYSTCAVRDWSFDQPFDEGRMVMGEGAVLDESTP